jgi:DNA polymerase-3 subunit alpha
VLESLVRCGAMDTLGLHRARLFNGIEFAMTRAAGTLRDRATGQGSLFDLLDDDDGGRAAVDDLPEVEPWPENELLAGEKELLGIYLSGHPLARYSWLLERYQSASIHDLASLPDRTPARVGGIAAQITRRVTKTSRQPMAVIQLDDLDGSLEVVVFPEAYQQYGAQLQQDSAILVCGEVSRREEPPRLMASEIYPLADAPKFFAERASIHVPAANHGGGHLPALKDIVNLHPGSTPLSICLVMPSGEKVFVEAAGRFQVCPDEAFVREVEHLLGEESVYVSVNPNPCRKPRTNGRRRRG